MKWFVKDIIKYFPGPGWGMKFLDCVFLKREWTQDREGVLALFEKYKANDIPLFLVSFLEGTRLTGRKLGQAQGYAKERGLPVPEQTLVPRTKGFVATMTGLREHLDAVYDVTIAYPKPTPKLLDCFRAGFLHVEVEVKRYPVHTLPTDEVGLTEWAFDAFEAKDQVLRTFRKEGKLAGAEQGFEVRVRDWFRPESEPFEPEIQARAGG